MKYVLLVAGRGTRITRNVGGIAKCLLDIKPDKKLIVNTLEQLLDYGVSPSDIMVVTGYQAGRVAQNISRFGVNITTNPFYDVTNSIASFWFIRKFINQDFIALNGDTYFETTLLDKLHASKSDLTLLADSSRIEDADYRLSWADGKLEKYGKELTNEETTGEYVGMAKVSGLGVTKFKSKLSELISSQKHGMWWEDVIYQLSDDGHPVAPVDIKGNFWAEVDYIEDYQRILQHVAKKDA
ncbi:MAG: phosphocholine cytidylyltransferase family protein [Pseudomonadota bacterium]